MKKIKHIVDTTMRDGEQSPGIAMSKEQKLLIADLLDSAGIYQIEAGIPAVSNEEIETIYEMVHRKKHSKIAVWNRMQVADVQKSFDCKPDIIHISVPVSYSQIYSKLGKNKAWIVKTLTMCVDLAIEKGFEVTVGFEDASRADITFMVSLATMLKTIGVGRIRFADTVGVLSPTRTYQAIKDLIDYTGIEVEFHAHNDLGMAIANALAGAKGGADYLDTTIYGIGERAGNCDFYKLVHTADLNYNFGISKLEAYILEQKIADILSLSAAPNDI